MSVKPLGQQPPPLDVAYGITAWHALRLSISEVAALRKKPPSGMPATIQAAALKHSDEQTVAAFSAVCGAAQSPALAGVSFDLWGIVASSRYIGRGAVTGTIEKYAKDGPWGVSMQLAPHHMLHSSSSTVGMALQCHGPCVGVGGGPNDEGDAILTAVSLLARPHLAGIWILFTAWEPELAVDSLGKPTGDSQCIAAALAVLPQEPKPGQSRLRVYSQQRRTVQRPLDQNVALTARFGQAAQRTGEGVSFQGDLGGGLHLDLELLPRGAESTAAEIPADPRRTMHPATACIPPAHGQPAAATRDSIVVPTSVSANTTNR